MISDNLCLEWYAMSIRVEHIRHNFNIVRECIMRCWFCVSANVSVRVSYGFGLLLLLLLLLLL